jgi:DNA polymerase III alpha subunit
VAQDLEMVDKYDLPDIDIDFKDRQDAIDALENGIPAAIIRPSKASKHNTGMYYHDIPVDPLTGHASLDHKAAEERGYFKLDFLNLGIYENVRDEQHLTELSEKEPNWNRLTTDAEFVSKIIHINNYFDLLKTMRPHSVAEMAMFLAIIRPGKKHLQGKQWAEVEQDVWTKTDEGYAFKQSHATSYAMAVVVHMNLLEELEHG